MGTIFEHSEVYNTTCTTTIIMGASPIYASSDNESYYMYDQDMYDFIKEEACAARTDYIARMTIFALFILFGVTGNLALLGVTLYDKKLRTAPNFLICNLAFADLIFILLTGPIRIEHELHPCWMSGQLACSLRNYAPVVCQCACVYSLVALSRERYSAIVKGIQSRMTNQMKVTVCWIAITWLFGIIFAVPILTQEFSYIWLDILCMYTERGSRTARIYECVKFAMLYIIPMIIITVHYSFMANALIKSTQMFKDNNNVFAKQARARKRLAYMAIALSVFFCILWLPSYIYTLMFHFRSAENFDGDTATTFRHVHYYMSLANSSFNPWLVFILSTSHRTRVMSALCCCCGFVEHRRGGGNSSNRYDRSRSVRDSTCNTETVRLNDIAETAT